MRFGFGKYSEKLYQCYTSIAVITQYRYVNQLVINPKSCQPYSRLVTL